MYGSGWCRIGRDGVGEGAEQSRRRGYLWLERRLLDKRLAKPPRRDLAGQRQRPSRMLGAHRRQDFRPI
jgi:hypothetical protein